jgi:t-SNARE complex subunit (syntaxin)
MREAEDEIKKMTDCMSARRMRGKNGDEVGTKRKVQCTSCAWSNVFQMMDSKIRKHFCHNGIVFIIIIIIIIIMFRAIL